MGSSTPSEHARREVAGVQRGWWLEDAIAGGVIEHPSGRTIDDAEHVWLAWVTGNASDVHGNADRAARGEFGQPVMLGALTVAVVLGLASPATGPAEEPAAITPPAWRSIRLGKPVIPGDTLTARSLIHEFAAGTVRRTVEGRNQRGEVVAIIEEEVAAAPRSDRVDAGSGGW